MLDKQDFKVKTLTPQSITEKAKTKCKTRDDQYQSLLNRLALSNRILIAEPLTGSKAIDEDRYQLTVNIKVPGQWTCGEIQKVLEVTEDWSWRGVLDAATLAELEALLDSVASREVAE